MPTPEFPAVLEIPEDDAVESLLGVVHGLIIRHPAAAQALFRALVAEGRAFAATDEGAPWASRLRRSELVRQGRVVWDAVSLNALDDREETVLPTAILDAFTRAMASEDVHGILRRVLAASLLAGGAPDDAG